MSEIDVHAQQFYQADILRVVPGLDVPKFQAWLTRGHLKLADHSPGSGRRRLWSALEVIQIAALWEMTRMMVPVSFAADIAPRFSERAEQLVRDRDEAKALGEHVLYIYYKEDADSPELFVGSTTERALHHVGRDKIFGRHSVVTEIRLDVLIDQVLTRLAQRLTERGEMTG